MNTELKKFKRKKIKSSKSRKFFRLWKVLFQDEVTQSVNLVNEGEEAGLHVPVLGLPAASLTGVLFGRDPWQRDAKV